MGSAVGGLLARGGQTVLWASDGRSEATARRARAAGLQDAGTVAGLVARSDLVLSVVPAPRARRDGPRGRARSRVSTSTPMRSRRRRARRGPGDRRGRRRALRRRRHHRPAAGGRPTTRLYLAGGAPARGRRAALRRDRLSTRASLGRRDRRGLGAEDGLRRLDEGQRRAAARRPRPRRGRRASRTRCSPSGSSSIPALAGPLAPGGARRRREGLALGRRDAGDRGHDDRGGPAAGLPRGGRRGVPGPPSSSVSAALTPPSLPSIAAHGQPSPTKLSHLRARRQQLARHAPPAPLGPGPRRPLRGRCGAAGLRCRRARPAPRTGGARRGGRAAARRRRRLRPSSRTPSATPCAGRRCTSTSCACASTSRSTRSSASS